MYKKYLLYVLEHKKNVFKIAIKHKEYTHAFLHDLSKFHPKEFGAYARWFHGVHGVESQEMFEQWKEDETYMELFGNKHLQCKAEFEKAWQHHKDSNKHHWNYWHERNIPMPPKYVNQMIIDWEAMSIKFGNTPQMFYLKNYNKIKFTDDDNQFCSSRHNLELKLGLLDYNMPFCECNYEVYMSIKQLIKDSEKLLSRNGHCRESDIKNHIDYIFKKVNDKYNISIYDLIK